VRFNTWFVFNKSEKGNNNQEASGWVLLSKGGDLFFLRWLRILCTSSGFVIMASTIILVKTKKYRDCIQHYVNIGSSSWAMMEQLQDSVWSAIVRIPDNPEARSEHLFIFYKNVDTLTMGWKLLTEFFAIVDTLLGSGSLSTIQTKSSYTTFKWAWEITPLNSIFKRWVERSKIVKNRYLKLI